MSLKLWNKYSHRHSHNPLSSKPEEYDCIATLSGGIDSTVIAHRLRDQDINPMFVYVNYGSVATYNELKACMETVKRLGSDLWVLEYPLYETNNLQSYILGNTKKCDEDSPFWLEGRNANIVLTLATIASMNNMHGVYIGINWSDSFGDLYPDTDLRFLHSMNALLACSFKSPVICHAPLLEEYLEKHDVIREGIEKWSINWTKETYSCSSITNGASPCLDYENCNSCSGRKHDFSLVGAVDPFEPIEVCEEGKR